MRVGFDFDNTIVCYDGSFHAAAVERGLVPPDLPADKKSVRDYCVAAGREDDWTELQGHVYGTWMDRVDLYPGVTEFMAALGRAGHSVWVVSHKSRTPYRGPPHDLHSAARRFIEERLTDSGEPIVAPSNVILETTLSGKIARIDELQFDVFIDDLPEVLRNPAFPQRTRRILFDPQGHHAKEADLEAYSSWPAISDAVLGPNAGAR